MEYIKLSKRLQAAADFVKIGRSILDIGSDHAYLPIYLVQQEKISFAIAGEVVHGPYNKAVSQVEKHRLEENISVRLGDGFDVLEESENVGTIFICGMGGLLISDIIRKGLTANKISHNTRLVLQANNTESHLRNLLQENNFEIIKETMIKENNKFYEVIVAEFSDKAICYTAEELLFGPKLLKEKSTVFIDRWHWEINKNKEIIKQLTTPQNEKKKVELTKKNQQIEKVIS